MELTLDEITKIISNNRERVDLIVNNKRYYDVENDIKRTGANVADENDPTRQADNRISHNFHQVIVDEKASYMFTYPVQFDLGEDNINERLSDVLGDDFEGISSELCVEASNCGTSFLHYWISKENNIKKFDYAVVPTEQVIANYSDNLKPQLLSVYRYYQIKEDEKDIVVFEVWDKNKFIRNFLEGTLNSATYKIYKEPEEVKHPFKKVPFIEFKNNARRKDDLSKYKDLVDLYDKVVSSYANDIEDTQQIIYILENYEGEDLGDFKKKLKKLKAVKVESGEGKGGLSTLQIEIPVDARNSLLEMVKKQIYESAQALQQDVESVGNASGTALKFFYRKLELKAGLTETEFKKSFNELVRVILKYLKINTDSKIVQTWTRNMISNDVESSQIAKNSVGLISSKTIMKNHPWVEDIAFEEEELKREKEIKEDSYNNIIPSKKVTNEE